MHCYKTLAATTLISNIPEILPALGRNPSPAAIADWMAQNDIEAEDILCLAPNAAKAKLLGLIKRRQISRAA